MNDQFKHAVTVAEMARMVGLSRSRFYQLIGHAMPAPNRDERGRPFYTEEQQRTILEVRRRNCGIDGKPVLFYAPRSTAPVPAPKRSPKPKPVDHHAAIIDGVQSLGLTATKAQVEAAIKQLFPSGLTGVDPGEASRQVFLYVEIMDGVQSLPLTATNAQVAAAIKQLFPSGLAGVDPGESIRQVFLHLKRQNSSDNVGQ